MDAIYARQSVEKKDSLSIRGQVELCRGESGSEVTVYQDKGYSGKNTRRPDFERMIRDVETGKISKIIVYRLDRFSRSIADFGRLWETLQAHGVDFISVSEKFDTSVPMGRAMLHIIMVFAQLERETIAERVKDNYYQRAALGAWPGGPAPYGFSIGRLQDAAGRKVPTLVENGDMAVVRRIFETYALEDSSLGNVARMLNADGIPAPRRATWDNISLSRILHSPLYVRADQEVVLYFKSKGAVFTTPGEAFDGIHGAMLVGKRDRTAGKYQDVKEQKLSLSNHEGAIPSALWLRCQDKLDRNRQLGCSGKGKYTWLSGLLKCASCGYSIKVNRDGERFYLVCSGRSNLSACGETIRVDLRELESAVQGELEQLLVQCPDEEMPGERGGEVEEALREIDAKIGRLMAALAEGSGLTMRYINRELAQLDERKNQLLQGHQEQRKEQGAPLGRVVFDRLNFEEKKLVAAQFIQNILLAKDRAEVVWAV